MTEVAGRLEIGTEAFDYTLRRSARKTLGISVKPDGSVVVTAPEAAEANQIEAVLRKRASWILDKVDESVLRTPPLPPRRYIPGETHYFLGRQYRLRVDPEARGTRREDDRIIVGGVASDEPSRIRNRLVRWYELQGYRIFSERLSACIQPFVSDFKRPKLKIVEMERRWGSYVPASHSLVLNHVLVQVPVPLIDYVITHELCHLPHPNHGPEFAHLLGKLMPDHARRKAKLERAFT
jgi:predicted metal-dependent hydrolase